MVVWFHVWAFDEVVHCGGWTLGMGGAVQGKVSRKQKGDAVL